MIYSASPQSDFEKLQRNYGRTTCVKLGITTCDRECGRPRGSIYLSILQLISEISVRICSVV